MIQVNTMHVLQVTTISMMVANVKSYSGSYYSLIIIIKMKILYSVQLQKMYLNSYSYVILKSIINLYWKCLLWFETIK